MQPSNQSRNPVTSFRLPEPTRNQMDELVAKWGCSMANIVTIAIDRMYQQEIQPMNIPLNYQPRTEYKGHAIEIAAGIGGYYARTTFKVNDDENQLLEVGPNDSEQGALQSMRNTIKDALFAYGFTDEPS